MKLSKSVSAVLLLAATGAAAVVMPMRIPFQGKLVDPATNNPKNGSFSMVFKIWDAPTGGTQLFTETQTVTVVNGQFSVQVGTIAYLSSDVLMGTSAYLGVTVGADAEMSPRQPLSMSGYAYSATQLISDKPVRINSGTAYSTFTTLGNWQFPYGVSAGSAAITDNVFTVGTSSFAVAGGSATIGYGLTVGGVTGVDANFKTVTSTNVGTFSVTSSSGISVLAGTLDLSAASRGIDAVGTGIVASTGYFVNTSTWAIQTTTGILVADGPLTMGIMSDGIDARFSSVTARQFFGVGATTTSIKPSDTNRASTAALADDPHLAIPVGANETYTVYSLLKASSTSATPDFKMGFTVPAGAAMDFGCYSNGGTLASVGTFALRDSGQPSPLVALGASIINPVICVGSVVNGGTAGFLKLQWSQNTSNGTNTTLTAGSFLSATRVR